VSSTEQEKAAEQTMDYWLGFSDRILRALPNLSTDEGTKKRITHKAIEIKEIANKEAASPKVGKKNLTRLKDLRLDIRQELKGIARQKQLEQHQKTAEEYVVFWLERYTDIVPFPVVGGVGILAGKAASRPAVLKCIPQIGRRFAPGAVRILSSWSLAFSGKESVRLLNGDDITNNTLTDDALTAMYYVPAGSATSYLGGRSFISDRIKGAVQNAAVVGALYSGVEF
jgi:hypothetical protein